MISARQRAAPEPRACAAGIAGPRGTRALARCGWAPPGAAGSVAPGRERVPSTPAARARRPAARRERGSRRHDFPNGTLGVVSVEIVKRYPGFTLDVR